ncbi:uncharacterized protein A1O5_03925 [Cladophialophora psammophila CBS 110553]|uniref:Uncharacterized protein n=1 Tax=Cladophialophora psammophila CBS 110553 TaxID=1182543 RepID=W9WXT6_9EURO|nr:uncharacterized protein A1O5_03925 [Cladophialophora psammophila CBS 110553]EXJ72778.1 hypothetical protein A1O5_03925 [Cladophialophora psammophila CBS 110553]
MASDSVSKEGFPMHWLEFEQDWLSFRKLLRNLLKLAAQRETWLQKLLERDPMWRSNDNAAQQEIFHTAKSIYHTVNASAVWELADLQWPLSKYITLFHPTSVGKALSDSDNNLDQPLSTEIKTDIMQSCENVYKELGDALKAIKRLNEEDLQSSEFAKNAGDPDDRSSSSSEGEDDEDGQGEGQPDVRYDMALVSTYHKKHQRAMGRLIKSAFEAARSRASDLRDIKMKIKAMDQELEKYNVGQQIPNVKLGVFPIDVMCSYWQNGGTEKDLHDTWIIHQFSEGFCRDPPVWTNKYPNIEERAAFFGCDPHSGIAINATTEKATRKKEKKKREGRQANFYRPLFDLPERKATQHSAEPSQGTSSRNAKFPTRDERAQRMAATTRNPAEPVFGNAGRSNKVGASSHPRKGNPPKPAPNPNVQYPVNFSHALLGGPSFLNGFRVPIQVRSTKISTDDIKPGYTLQGHRIVAWKSVSQIVKGPQGPRESEYRKYVVRLAEHEYQYRTQDECGGGAVWGRLASRPQLLKTIMQIDVEKGQLYKDAFQQFGFGLDWVALPPQMSVIPSSKPPTVVGVWYRKELEGPKKQMAIMWTTLVHLVGKRLAEAYVAQLFERAYNVQVDAFKMGGLWAALEVAQPLVSPPNGLSRAHRQAQLFAQSGITQQPNQFQIPWPGIPAGYAKSLSSQRSIFNGNTHTSGSGRITKRAGPKTDPGEDEMEVEYPDRNYEEDEMEFDDQNGIYGQIALPLSDDEVDGEEWKTHCESDSDIDILPTKDQNLTEIRQSRPSHAQALFGGNGKGSQLFHSPGLFGGNGKATEMSADASGKPERPNVEEVRESQPAQVQGLFGGNEKAAGAEGSRKRKSPDADPTGAKENSIGAVAVVN